MKGESIQDDEENSLQLHSFAARGQLENCKKMINQYTKVDHQDDLGWTPLMFAARFGHVNTMKFLHSIGGSLTCRNIYGYTPLCMAVASDCKEAFEYVLQEVKRSKEDLKREIISFEVACVLGRTEFLKIFLSLEEFDVNQIQCKLPGITPLLLTVYSGNVEASKLLLAAGANQSAVLNAKPSALEIAIYNRNEKMQALFSTDKVFSALTPTFLSPSIDSVNSSVFTFSTSPFKEDARNNFQLHNYYTCHSDVNSFSYLKVDNLLFCKHASTQSIHADVGNNFHHLDGLLSPRVSNPKHDQSERQNLNETVGKNIKQTKLFPRKKYLSWVAEKLIKRRTKSVDDICEHDKPKETNDELRIRTNMILTELLTKMNLEKYISTFIINEMDPFTVFTLTENDLIAMGISKREERRNILEALERYK